MDGHPSVTVDGKTAVVIGGTSGIGEAIALGLADDGADVVATSRTAEDVAATAESLRDAGATTIEEPCDVTDRESIRTLCDRVLDEVGEVDILVNSAGTAARSGLLDLDEESWEAVLDVQLTGVFRTCQEFARVMDSGASSTSRRRRPTWREPDWLPTARPRPASTRSRAVPPRSSLPTSA